MSIDGVQPDRIEVEGVRIAVRHRLGRAPGAVWLGGYLSDMMGTKAERLDRWAADTGHAFTRHDYSGHGESGGKFADGTISKWLAESLAVFRRFTEGPQILVGSSMGAWVALRMVQETEEAGWTAAANNECLLLCQRRSEALAPEVAYREISNAWQLRPRQLGCLQKLAEWRLRQARERDLAVNFVVREENLWQVARFMPSSLGELDSLGLSGPEIRYHGKTLLALVAEAEALEESELPAPLANLIDQPGYKKVFKDIKAAIATVSEQSGLSSELLASRRQINQLLNWHWKLKDGESRPELISGWRGDLLMAPLQDILKDY